MRELACESTEKSEDNLLLAEWREKLKNANRYMEERSHLPEVDDFAVPASVHICHSCVTS